VFVAGSASGVKDIPDSILHAGAAVAQAAAHIEKAKSRRGVEAINVAVTEAVEVGVSAS
jgi:heterodisulfide reductase subunit A-like polyferredoxin